MGMRVIEVTDFKFEVRFDHWDNLESNIGKIPLQVMRGSPLVIQFVPAVARAEEGAAARPKGETAGFAPSSLRNSSGFIFEGKIVDVLGNLFIFAFDLGWNSGFPNPWRVIDANLQRAIWFQADYDKFIFMFFWHLKKIAYFKWKYWFCWGFHGQILVSPFSGKSRKPVKYSGVMIQFFSGIGMGVGIIFIINILLWTNSNRFQYPESVPV